MSSDTFRILHTGGVVPIPGTCCICGFDRRDFVDWGLNIEYYGAVLICVECINNLGQLEELDFATRQELNDARATIRNLMQTIREYERMRRKLEDGLVRVASDFGLDFDNVGSVDSIKLAREEEPVRLDPVIVSSKPSYSDAF